MLLILAVRTCKHLHIMLMLLTVRIYIHLYAMLMILALRTCIYLYTALVVRIHYPNTPHWQSLHSALTLCVYHLYQP